MIRQDFQKVLDELEASRRSRRRAWANLLDSAAKTIDLEGRLVKDGLRSAIRDRQIALSELVDAMMLTASTGSWRIKNL
jgi:hypothetical protein